MNKQPSLDQNRKKRRSRPKLHDLPPKKNLKGGSSAQSPKTRSLIELSRTSSEPAWWRIAAATGPRTPNVADSIATAFSPKANKERAVQMALEFYKRVLTLRSDQSAKILRLLFSKA